MRALIPSPDDPALGLSKKEVLFVRAYAETGKVTPASIAAGWSISHGGKALHRPKVSAAILFESQRRMVTGAPIAVRTILQLAANAISEKVRLDASKFLIEQNLGKALERIQLDISLPAEEKELLARISELAKELGIRTIDITPEVVMEATDA